MKSAASLVFENTCFFNPEVFASWKTAFRLPWLLALLRLFGSALHSRVFMAISSHWIQHCQRCFSRVAGRADLGTDAVMCWALLHVLEHAFLCFLSCVRYLLGSDTVWLIHTWSVLELNHDPTNIKSPCSVRAMWNAGPCLHLDCLQMLGLFWRNSQCPDSS